MQVRDTSGLASRFSSCSSTCWHVDCRSVPSRNTASAAVSRKRPLGPRWNRQTRSCRFQNAQLPHLLVKASVLNLQASQLRTSVIMACR